MNNIQKERIAVLRSRGESYARIADALDISVNTVQSYCRRNGLGAGYVPDKPADESNGVCANCGKPLTQRQGSKKKRFCSDKCRSAWWASHPEQQSRAATYSFTCVHCGKPFTAYGDSKRKYCCHACYVAERFGKAAAL